MRLEARRCIKVLQREAKNGMTSIKKHISRCAFVAAALVVLLPAAGPSFAVDAKQKMATCKFGADHQRLQGEARDAFLKKCMEDRDDPRGPAPAGAPKQ